MPLLQIFPALYGFQARLRRQDPFKLPIDNCAHQILFTTEVVVKLRLAGTAVFENFVKTRATDAMFEHEIRSSVNDRISAPAPARSSGQWSHRRTSAHIAACIRTRSGLGNSGHDPSVRQSCVLYCGVHKRGVQRGTRRVRQNRRWLTECVGYVDKCP